jgi:hypothetical protein
MDFIEQIFLAVAEDTASDVRRYAGYALAGMTLVGALVVGFAYVASSVKLRRLQAEINDADQEVPPDDYIAPVPEVRCGPEVPPHTVELTVSYKPHVLRAMARADEESKKSWDLLRLVTAAVPEAELITGNVRYAISVRVPAGEERILRSVLETDCHVSERAMIEFFAN